MRVPVVAVLAGTMVLVIGCACKQPRTVSAINSPFSLAEKDALTDKEKKAIAGQKKILDEIMQLFAKHALERPTDFTACVREMFAMRRSKKCRDEFTYYSTPEEAKRHDEDSAGKFGGIGIEITREEDKIRVIAVIIGMPAAKAGIKIGDIILKVDGEKPRSASEAASLIRGKLGTTVALTISRGNDRKEFMFTLVRETVVVQAVRWRLSSIDKTIGIIEIRHFNKTAPLKFSEAVIDLAKKGVKNIIVDLRDNPGGLFGSATSLLSFFARDDDIIVTIRYRHSRSAITPRDVFSSAAKNLWMAPAWVARAFREDFLKKIGVVVLINKGSASASEIFAGAMKDWGYPLVGEKSYGKGVGQDVITLSDGSRLTLTTFEFLVGNRMVAIRDNGVQPTTEVKSPEENRASGKDERGDLQLMKAIEVLQSCGKKDPARSYECVRKR